MGNFDLNLLFNTFQTRRDDTTGRGQKAVRMRICTYDHINAHEGAEWDAGERGMESKGWMVQHARTLETIRSTRRDISFEVRIV